VRLSDYYCKLLIIEVFTERGIAAASGSTHVPHAYQYGAATPRWEELEKQLRAAFEERKLGRFV